MNLKRDLSYFDLMNLVIGAIVGSDIFIIPGIVGGLIGPFSILIWILGGAMATVLALVFAYSSFYVPKVGGPFAYVSKAFDNFYGFIAGWSMCIAEIVVLPVFAIVFTDYLEYFIPLTFATQLTVRVAFILILTIVNIIGVKAAGKVNDALTLIKLTPLFLIIVLGVGSIILHPNLIGNYSPIAPMGLNNFGPVLVLVFWAYAGFELGTLPAGEVVNPKKNVPRAMISGMAIVIFFYVMTNVAVYGVVNWADLSKTHIPLVLVGSALLGTVGAAIVVVGALASVSGTEESEVLGSARLIYAMSGRGFLPKALGKVHPRLKTPYFAVIMEGAIALVLVPFSGISQLISFAVFNLAICYLLVCLSLPILRKKQRNNEQRDLRGQNVLPWIGAGISLYLLYSTSLFDKLVGTLLVLLGIPVYLYFSKINIHKVRGELAEETSIFAAGLQRESKPLGNFIRLMIEAYRKMKTKNSG